MAQPRPDAELQKGAKSPKQHAKKHKEKSKMKSEAKNTKLVKKIVNLLNEQGLAQYTIEVMNGVVTIVCKETLKP